MIKVDQRQKCSLFIKFNFQRKKYGKFSNHLKGWLTSDPSNATFTEAAAKTERPNPVQKPTSGWNTWFVFPRFLFKQLGFQLFVSNARYCEWIMRHPNCVTNTLSLWHLKLLKNFLPFYKNFPTVTSNLQQSYQAAAWRNDPGCTSTTKRNATRDPGFAQLCLAATDSPCSSKSQNARSSESLIQAFDFHKFFVFFQDLLILCPHTHTFTHILLTFISHWYIHIWPTALADLRLLTISWWRPSQSKDANKQPFRFRICFTGSTSVKYPKKYLKISEKTIRFRLNFGLVFFWKPFFLLFFCSICGCFSPSTPNRFGRDASFGPFGSALWRTAAAWITLPGLGEEEKSRKQWNTCFNWCQMSHFKIFQKKCNVQSLKMSEIKTKWERCQW